MNNKERLEFIKKYHRDLYKLLEVRAQMCIDNMEFMNVHDINECNKCVSLYCQRHNISDPQLCQTLLFRIC